MLLIASREVLKGFFFSTLRNFGYLKSKLKKINTKNEVLILNLHKVSNEVNPYWPPLKINYFNDLISYLKKETELVTFQDLKFENLTKKPRVIISFDDGYRDFFDCAMPILKKYKISVNQNIIPEAIETGLAPWNIRMYDFLFNAPENLLKNFKVHGWDLNFKNLNEKEKSKFGLKLSIYLKNRSKKERERLLQNSMKWINEFKGTTYSQMMDRNQLLEVYDLHEIGLHSYSHESMQFESTEYFQQDLEKCWSYYFNLFQFDPDIYAFPNGSYREGQPEMAVEQGYKFVLLVGDRVAESHSSILNRVTHYGESSAEAVVRGVGYGISI